MILSKEALKLRTKVLVLDKGKIIQAGISTEIIKVQDEFLVPNLRVDSTFMQGAHFSNVSKYEKFVREAKEKKLLHKSYKI